MATTPKRTDLDLNEFRRRLLKERARLIAAHRREERDIRSENKDASEDELSAYSTFDPAENEDTAAILADVERFEAWDENEKEILRQVDAALARLEDGTYGLDEITGEPIPIARLRALPWATMTVENAERTNL